MPAGAAGARLEAEAELCQLVEEMVANDLAEANKDAAHGKRTV